MSILYGIYLVNYNNVVRIPINPINEYTIEHGTDNSTYDILSIGEVTIPRIPKQRVVEWESFFPRDPRPYYVVTKAEFREAQYYINLIRTFMANKTVLQLVIDRRHEYTGEIIFSDNFKVTVEEFNLTERGQETGDFYYTIRLKEYRDFTPSIVEFNEVPVIVDENLGTTEQQIVATIVQQRETSDMVITAGDSVFVSGNYYSDQFGSQVIGTISNKQLTVSRISLNTIEGQLYNYYIAGYGWVDGSQIRKNGLYNYS